MVIASANVERIYVAKCKVCRRRAVCVAISIEWILASQLCQLCAAGRPGLCGSLCRPVGMRYAAQSVEIGLDCVAVLCLGHEMIVQVVLPSLVSCLGCFLKLPLLYCTARM